MPHNEFQQRVRLIRALKSPQWDAYSRVRGSITFNPDLFEIFENLRATDEAEWEGTGASPTVGSSGNVLIKLQHGKRGATDNGYIVENVNALLNFQVARLDIVSPIFLADENWATDEPSEPSSFLLYRQAVRFIQWLRERADVADGDHLVFLLGEKLELDVKYCFADLKKEAFSEIDTLEQLLAFDLHKDQRRAIAVQSLIDMLASLPQEDRFSHLLANLPDFIERVSEYSHGLRH